MPISRVAAFVFLTTTISTTSFDAGAVVDRIFNSATAVNACQSALPAYEGQLRKRPLSVQNEGSAIAFVTCGMNAENPLVRAEMYLNSFDGQSHVVNCTAVVGYQGIARYVTKQVTVQGNGLQYRMFVEPADLGFTADLDSYYVTWSCQLPPGAGINDLAYIWDQDVGN